MAVNPKSLKNLRKWKKGQSGNPNGGWTKGVSIANILREIGIELIDTPYGKMTKRQAMLRTVQAKALKGDPWAVQFIADRTEGKAVDRMQVDGKLDIKWKSLSTTSLTLGSGDSTTAAQDSE